MIHRIREMAISTKRVEENESRLNRLYFEELEEKDEIPRLRGAKILAFLSIIGIIIFSASLFYRFNMFILLREDVYAKVGNMESAIQRRDNLFANLVNLTLNHAMLEEDIFVELAKQRAKMTASAAKTNNDAKATVKASLEKAYGKLPTEMTGMLDKILAGGAGGGGMGRLLAVVEQYPTIKTSETYHTLMTSLTEMETMITTRRMEYHSTLRIYNTAISKFPWYIIARLTNFSRMDYYAIKDEKHPTPVINGEMYRELTPMRAITK
ncbi:MAG: LemA family protein [Mariprofundus sp.]|nr:LemA family protein [Mariprofundus sp.]